MPSSNTPVDRPTAEQLAWAIAVVESDPEPDNIGLAARWLLLELKNVALGRAIAERDAIQSANAALKQLVEAVDGMADMDEADGHEFFDAERRLESAMENAKRCLYVLNEERGIYDKTAKKEGARQGH